MDARKIAIELIDRCAFEHKDGRAYKDDALDTWACLYADLYPAISWEEIDTMIDTIKKERNEQK